MQKKIFEFIKKLDYYNIDYNLSKENNWNSIIFYKKLYSWDRKGSEWTNFLTGAIHAKR